MFNFYIYIKNKVLTLSQINKHSNNQQKTKGYEKSFIFYNNAHHFPCRQC